MATEITDTQLEYIDWRADPTRNGSKESWAADHGTTAATLRRWEKTPWFRQGLERRLAELNIEPERLQVVLDTLWREAKDGDVNAAKAYFAAIEDMRPKRTRIEDTSLVDLTDEELEEAWAEGMAHRQRQRALQ